MIAARFDTGVPCYLDALRGVHRDGTAIFLHIHSGEKLLAVIVLTDEEAEAHLREVASQLPTANRHIIAEELGRV